MDSSTRDWLEQLAAKVPTPGGGAVAALSAAIAAAQLGMVAIYTTGPKWQDREADMQALSDELAGLRTDALALVEADAKAFASVGAAYQLPKKTDSEKSARGEAIQKALIDAAEPPAQTTKLAERIVDIAQQLSTTGNPNVISDVAVGASLAIAALESAIVNIEINEREIKDPTAKQTLQQAVETASTYVQKAREVTGSVRKQIGSV